MSFIARRVVGYHLGFVTALLTITSCGGGGGGGGPAAPAPGVPGLSNLQATLASACTLQGQPSTIITGTVDYIDSDGDIKGGTLLTTGTFLPSGNSGDVNFPLPSQNATLTGTTQGTITAQACVHFGADTSFTLTVAVADTAGHTSNVLTTKLDRPPGAPELPVGGDRSGAFGQLRR